MRPAAVADDLVSQTVELSGRELRVLQPIEAAELPDAGGIEWAPIAPYWAVLWRSGVALAREVDRSAMRGLRVVELGCGLALPSLAAARAGAEVLATDSSAEALELVTLNARNNGVGLATALVDWTKAGDLVARGPFDLVLAADVLYETAATEPLLSLLPRLAPEAWVADPGRSAAEPFLARAAAEWAIETTVRDPVTIHRMRMPRRDAHHGARADRA